MRTIHGKLTPEKVDETMYAFSPGVQILPLYIIAYCDTTGTSYGSKTHSAKKSSPLLRATISESLWTKRSWKTSSRRYSRNSSTRKCSNPAACLCRMRSTGCPPSQTKKVGSPCPLTGLAIERLILLNSFIQTRGCRGRRRRSRTPKTASRDGHVRLRLIPLPISPLVSSGSARLWPNSSGRTLG